MNSMELLRKALTGSHVELTPEQKSDIELNRILNNNATNKKR